MSKRSMLSRSMLFHASFTRRLAAAAAIAMLAPTAPPVFAQGAAMLEEITVTARKREERLQDTPISVTALTGAMLEQRQIDTLDGIAGSTPNLEFDNATTFSGTNAAAVYLRGIGQIDFTLTTEPGVGIYVDGVYLSQSIGSVLSLVDIDAIEVLRGPQGTLFGRNTIGGAINIRSKLPDDKLHGEAEVTGGTYGRVDGRAMLNVPLADGLYAKASFASFNQKGFLDAPNQSGDLGDTGKNTGRIALRWAPGGRFEANFNADYSRQRENGVPHILTNTYIDDTFGEGMNVRRNNQDRIVHAIQNSTPFPAMTEDGEPHPLAGLRMAVPPPGFADMFNLLSQFPIGERGCFPDATVEEFANFDDQSLRQDFRQNMDGVVCPRQTTIVSNPDFGKQAITDAAAYDINDSNRANNSELDLSSDSDIWGVAMTMDYEITDDLRLKSITSYRDTESRTGYDADGTASTQNALIDEFEMNQFSQELQLSGAALDGRLQYVFGLYHFQEDGLNLDDVEFTPVRILSGAKIDNRSNAVFSQFTFDATERLSLTAGFRYTHEKKKFILDETCHELPKGAATLFDGEVVTCAPLQTVVNPKYLNRGFQASANALAGVVANPLPDGMRGMPLVAFVQPPRGLLRMSNGTVIPTVENDYICCIAITDADGNVTEVVLELDPGYRVLPLGTTTRTFDDWTPHVNLAYRWHSDLMTYFSWSQGFKSGGFVQRVFPPSTGVASFDPETANVFEGGVKWIGMDGALRVNAAGFHTQYDDLQVQVYNSVAPVTRNAAEAEINGAELEIAYLPAPGWLLNGSLGWLDAGYTDLDPEQNFDEVDMLPLTVDNDLVNTPEWSAAVGLQYTYRFAHGGELISRLDWSWKAEASKDALNYPDLYQEAFHLLDIGVSYISRDGRWIVSGFGKNVTNEDYFVSGWANGWIQQTATINLGRPSEWGLSVKYLFGDTQ